MKKSLWLLGSMLWSGVLLFAQKSEIYIKSGKAIRGYDPVAYFTESKPVEGKETFIYNWKGADWYFSSKKNLDMFIANPEKYAPQYGGYCAYGLSNGYKASIDEEAWTIENGKLYLNYSLSVRDKWNINRKERIAQADKNWPAVKDKD